MRIILALWILMGVAQAADWPVRDVTPEPRHFAAMEAYLFDHEIDEVDRHGIRTDGVVIIKDGALVYERYGRGYTKDMPHLWWSMSKSVIQALYGRAVQQGLVDIDRLVTEKSPWIGVNEKGEISYRHLLWMASGIDFYEGYEGSPLKSDVVAMLYTRGRGDMAKYAASRPRAWPPGTHMYYSSGDTNILSAALRDILGDAAYTDYPWDALFTPLGMTSAVWERDGADVYVGSSYLYSTPRDMARFGQLYLQGGVWQGERLLPGGWVDFARTPNPAFIQTVERLGSPYKGRGYGAQWWLNTEMADRSIPTAWPNVPPTVYAALGHWKQGIYVLPSHNMVIVRTADDKDEAKVFDDDIFLAHAIAAFGGAAQ